MLTNNKKINIILVAFLIIMIFIGAMLSGVAFFNSLVLVLAAVAVLFLPGYFWLPVFFQRKLDIFEEIGWSFIVSVSWLVAHIFLLNIIFDIRLSAVFIIAVVAVEILEVLIFRNKFNKKIQNNKILFLINNLGIGGAEKIFVAQANGLKRSGYDVHFAMLFPNSHDKSFVGHLEIDKEKIISLDAKSVIALHAIFRLKKYIKDNDISVVYSTLNDSNMAAKIIKVLLPGVGIYTREANVAQSKSWKLKMADILTNFLVRKIITVSDEVKKTLGAYQPFYSGKMVVLENGVMLPSDVKKYGTATGEIRILNIGSLSEKKGQMYLLAAFRDIIVKYDNLRLVIVGDGEMRPKIQDYISKHGMAGKVELVGKIDNKRVAEYYLGSDIFVLSSLWEGCPNVLLEAMSYGLVCVATKTGGCEKIIKDGISGFLVSPKDAGQLEEKIVYLLDNQSRFYFWGQEARKNILENYSIENNIKKLISILQS